MGLRPLPRIPTFHILPYPPPGPSFTVLWRGLGGQRRLSTPLIREVCGLAVSCPFPKNDNSSDGKGAMVPWTMRPIYSLVSYACLNAMQQQEGAAKPRRRSRPKETKTEGKGKGQEGFLRCGCQVGIPTFNTMKSYLLPILLPTSTKNAQINFIKGLHQGTPKS